MQAADARSRGAAAQLQSLANDRDALEAQARELAFAFAQSLALSLQVRHADWALRNENDSARVAAARRFSELLAS